jgi:hypothetical protein
MADFDITKDYPFGDMNPLLPKPGKIYRDNETSGIETIAQTAAETYELETILGTGPYKAICLRVDNGDPQGQTRTPQKMTWLDRMYSSFGGEPTGNHLEVKAMIPEIHGAMYATPKNYDDHRAINRFPTFVARQARSTENVEAIPSAGDYIWVDFGNRVTLQDPIYIGTLAADSYDALKDRPTDPCKNVLSTTANNGDQVKTTQETVAKIGPTMAPEYTPIEIDVDRGEIPKGKGVYLRGGLTPIDLNNFPVKKAIDAGISWVSIWVYKIKKNGEEEKLDMDSLRLFIDEYHKNGIRCYIYGWAAIGAGKGYNENEFKKIHGQSAEPEEMFIKNMVEYLTYSGAFGIEVDCEEDCYAKDTSKQVDEKWQYSTEVIARNEDFARRLKEQCENLGVTLGITTTTPNSSSAKIGHYYKSWGKYCDYAVVQTYSASGFWGPNHWKKGYNNMVSQGFKNIIPGMGGYDVSKKSAQGTKIKYAKTPDRMRWELHACYSQDLGWSNAIIWWAWGTLNERNRWSVVKELGSSAAESGAMDENPEQDAAEAQTSTAGTGSPGATTKTPVSSLGPTPGTTPATQTSTKSAEVVKDKKPAGSKKRLSPGARFKASQKQRQQALNKKIKEEIIDNRDFEKHPITITDLIAFTDETPKEIRRLLQVTGPDAAVTAEPQDVNKIEQLKSQAKDAILRILKKGTPESKIKILEKQIVALKKQLKEVDNSGTTSDPNSEASLIKAEIQEREDEIKSLLEAAAAATRSREKDTPPCPPGTFEGGSDSEDGDPVFSDVPTNVQLVEPIPYKENRVRAHVYGYLKSSDPRLKSVEFPHKNAKGKAKGKIHVLAAKRFDLMNRAWVEESGQEPFLLLSGWTPAPSKRWKKLRKPPYTTNAKYQKIQQILKENPKASTYDLFLAFLIDEYKKEGMSDEEAIKEGRRWRGWFSPHTTGLAVDIYYKDKDGTMSAISKKADSMRKMKLFKWLKNNAHTYGFSPYRTEPWHWECQIPLKAYKTGQEFTDDLSVRVEETSLKTGYPTSHARYAKKPFK